MIVFLFFVVCIIVSFMLSTCHKANYYGRNNWFNKEVEKEELKDIEKDA